MAEFVKLSVEEVCVRRKQADREFEQARDEFKRACQELKELCSHKHTDGRPVQVSFDPVTCDVYCPECGEKLR